MIVTSAFENALIGLREAVDRPPVSTFDLCIPHPGTNYPTVSDDNDGGEL